MKKYAFLVLLLLALPASALGDNVKIDLTFEDSSSSSNILVADAFKTIKRSNISLNVIKDLQNKVDKLSRENADLRQRLDNLERKVK